MLQRGDELIGIERGRVTDSLSGVQERVVKGLAGVEDQGAFVVEMMGERCNPWFSLDVARAAKDFFDVFRTDVEAPASLLMSVLQPQQRRRPPGFPIHVMVGMFFRNGSKDCFHLHLSGCDTVAHLKVQIETKTGIARNRLRVTGVYSNNDHPNDEDELQTLLGLHSNSDLKVHCHEDHPDQVIVI